MSAKYEYKVLSLHSNFNFRLRLEQHLNELGRDGWHCVGVVPTLPETTIILERLIDIPINIMGDDNIVEGFSFDPANI